MAYVIRAGEQRDLGNAEVGVTLKLTLWHWKSTIVLTLLHQGCQHANFRMFVGMACNGATLDQFQRMCGPQNPVTM